MNTLKLPARLIDKRHKEHLVEIKARIEPDGIYIPVRTTLQGVVFEITSVRRNGMLVYFCSPRP